PLGVVLGLEDLRVQIHGLHARADQQHAPARVGDTGADLVLNPRDLGFVRLVVRMVDAVIHDREITAGAVDVAADTHGLHGGVLLTGRTAGHVDAVRGPGGGALGVTAGRPEGLLKVQVGL